MYYWSIFVQLISLSEKVSFSTLKKNVFFVFSFFLEMLFEQVTGVTFKKLKEDIS